MSRPLIAFGSDTLVHTALAGHPRQTAALELLRLAAGGPRVLTLQALGGFFFVATREGLATRPAAAAGAAVALRVPIAGRRGRNRDGRRRGSASPTGTRCC